MDVAEAAPPRGQKSRRTMQCALSGIDDETVAHRVCGHSSWRQSSHYFQNCGELPLRAEDGVAVIAIIVNDGRGQQQRHQT